LMRLLTVRANRRSPLQDLNYTYDPVGNITRIRDDAQQTIYFNNQVVLPHCDYSYDSIYRLIEAAGREHIGQVGQRQETKWDDEFRVNLPHRGDGQAMRNYSEQYLYDAVGNFEQLIHQAANGNWTRAYAYNEGSLIEPGKQSNRLSSTSVGQSTEPYTYDAHGNMTSMPHLSLMQWNYKDELSATARQVVNSGVSETTFYVYDASGERVRKVTEGQNGKRKHERIYLGGFEIYREFKNNGDIKLERETLHVMDDKQRIALVETKTITNPDDESPMQLIRYQLGNHLGSASLELDDGGSVISYEEYYPYGSTAYQAVDKGVKAAAKRYRYTGMERDEETGLAYHGARYYMPWLASWVSCDPAGMVDGSNLYRYVRNTPILLNDPNGMDPGARSYQERSIQLDMNHNSASGAVSYRLTVELQNPNTGDRYRYSSSGDVTGLRSVYHQLLGNSGFAEALRPEEREGLFSNLENFAQNVGSVPAEGQASNSQDEQGSSGQDRPVIVVLGALGDTARGLAADRALPQRYRLEPPRGATVTGIRDTQAGRVRGTPPRPVGAPVIRVDQPHGSTNYPHVNIETLNPDPHVRISPNALRAAGRLAGGLEAVGRVARPVAIVTDVARLGAAIYEDEGIGRNTARTSASVAGGWAGAFAGAWVGAKAGAALGGLLGSFVPVLGNAAGAAIGGLLGGLIGGIAGGYLGSSAGEYATDAILE
jgi:RHS repeat-associated protein